MRKWNQDINFKYANFKSPPGHPKGDAEQAAEVQVAGRERCGLQTQSWEVQTRDSKAIVRMSSIVE